ncbi:MULTISPECIES: hypothetical protein [unclassified Shewanella]|uniref:hypothetical protein n=1 Tax=unclassified Shewanella TaxID=196818 RepID=UPI000C815C01|nr:MULTISPECIES: hypothetical protein [unclassified Shewanella]MDO6775611.1 hypothetical protein [Shewanella sp. 3_MG-2023]PMG40390.1 hypothetical protein BCU91_13060 [Shewanella sp. 10N.286.52.B9]
MSKYEIISSLVSLLAIVVSSVSLIRTRKLAKEQLELERVTAELSKLQIESIELEKADKIKPKFNVSLTKLGKSYSFYISNTGQGSAFDVRFELVDCENSPLCSDVEEKFPHPEMKPNTRVKLIAAICLGSPLKYQAKITWKDLEKESHEELFWVTV